MLLGALDLGCARKLLALVETSKPTLTKARKPKARLNGVCIFIELHILGRYLCGPLA